MTYLPFWSCVFTTLNGFDGRYSNTFVENYWKNVKTIYIDHYNQKPSRFVRNMIDVVPKLDTKMAFDFIFRSNFKTPTTKNKRSTPKSKPISQKKPSSQRSANNPKNIETWKPILKAIILENLLKSILKEKRKVAKSVCQLFLRNKKKTTHTNVKFKNIALKILQI